MLIMEFDLELLSNNFSVTHMILAIPNCLTITNAVIYIYIVLYPSPRQDFDYLCTHDLGTLEH